MADWPGRNRTSETAVGLLVVAVGLLDVAAQAVDREIHLGEFDGLEGLFLTVDEETGIFLLASCALR